MTLDEANARCCAEFDRVWPGWQGEPGRTNQVGFRLEQRGDVFDYGFVNVGSRLQVLVDAVHTALGPHAGVIFNAD